MTLRIDSRKDGHIKTNIDFPDAIFEQTKIAAALHRTTIKHLVIEGLEVILRQETKPVPPADALARLRQGYHLGNPQSRFPAI